VTVDAILYRWPSGARFGRVVPKTKFYEHARVSAAGRERFVAEVQRITGSYKLAEATIHLRGNDEVPEIQVFEIEAKDADVSDTVLAAIDKAVPLPIVFEVTRTVSEVVETRMMAAHKRLGGAKMRVGGYFSTPWQVAGSPRVPLPPALDLAGLYAGLLAPLLPVPLVPGEALSQTIERVEQAAKLEREIAVLERRLRAEPQLNRKVELRRQTQSRSAQLAALIDPEPSTTKDTAWTS
jgi:hypothetical protein